MGAGMFFCRRPEAQRCCGHDYPATTTPQGGMRRRFWPPSPRLELDSEIQSIREIAPPAPIEVIFKPC